MLNTCKKCGCTPTEALVDAAALGLQTHFESGLYTCCQIAAWATEQWEAWTNAAIEDDARTPVSSGTQSNLNHFLSHNDPAVPNWDAVAKLFNIQFIDC